MIKKILTKVFGIKFGPIEWIGDFPQAPKFKFFLYNPIHYNLCEKFINSIGGYSIIQTEKDLYERLSSHLKKNNVDIDSYGYFDFIREYENRYLRNIVTTPTISGTNSYSYGSENVLKKLPKRDSKGKFCK